MLIGLFNAMLGIPIYYDEPFPDCVVSALFYLFLWPLQAAFKILVGLNVATGWVLGKLMG
jgi:hypothetical protein